jgi:predicted aspartyl protease
MAASHALQQEIAAFETNRGQLVTKSSNKYVLVHGDEIVAIYESESKAIEDGRSRFGYVPILVERITADTEVGLPTMTAYAPSQHGGDLLAPISWKQSFGGGLHHFGPVAMVTIGVTDADSEAIIRSGAVVPTPIRAGALIDTGSTYSSLDQQFIAQLGLQPVGRIDVSGFDSTITLMRYEAEIVFEDGMHLKIIGSSAQLSRPAESRVPSYQALIGRDVLNSAIFTYDGIHGEVKLQFRTTD